MTLKNAFFAVALVFIATSAQATAITTPSVTISGGSNANAIWRAPLNQTYKVSVFIPATATAMNALYRVYPKGKGTKCLSTGLKPCFEITVNQSLNKNKWLQLTVNNNASTYWAFLKTTGYVTVASNALSATENLGVAGVRFDLPYSKIANDGSLLADSAVLGTGAKDWACSRDNVTGMLWEVKTNDGGLRDKDNTYSWYNPNSATNGGNAGFQNLGVCSGGIHCDTDSYVSAVNAQKVCGYSDWRIPSYDNLNALVDQSYSPPAINHLYFPDASASIDTWSSSSDVANNSNAWGMAFSYGYGYRMDKSSGFVVRLVRGGQ